MKVNKKGDVSASLREKIVSGQIGEYIPEKQSYKSYKDLVVEYQNKLFKFLQDNEPLPPKWNEIWFEQNGYLVKPDSPRGSLLELDLFRVDSQTKRKFQGYKQTPTAELIEGWGSNAKLKSPFNLEKLEAHHVRGLMQESTFLQGLGIDKATELTNRMWKSGRTKLGNTKGNRIDLQEFQHLNPYSAEELAVLREADPDAVGIVFNKEKGKWEKQGWTKKNNKWSNPLYKGTGAHNLLAEHGISDIIGAPMFSPETTKGMRGKSLDELFEDWSGWYDYTDRTIEQVLVEAKTNPRNFRGNVPSKGKARTFKELLQVERQYTPNQVMNIVDEAFPELSPEARLLVEADVFGPDPARQPKIRNLLAKPTATLEKSRIEQQRVNDALREAIFKKDSKRIKVDPDTRNLWKVGGVNWGEAGDLTEISRELLGTDAPRSVGAAGWGQLAPSTGEGVDLTTIRNRSLDALSSATPRVTRGLRQGQGLVTMGLGYELRDPTMMGVGAFQTGIQTRPVQKQIAKQTIRAVNTKVGQAIARRTAAQLGKTGTKAIPVVGDLAIGLPELWNYTSRGKFKQAGVSAVSTVIGMVPLKGDLISATLDGWNMYEDIKEIRRQLGEQEGDETAETTEEGSEMSF